jgi:hypothetical protein
MRSSSINKNVEVVFRLPRYWCRLPFAKILRSSSIGQSSEIVFHLETNCCRLPYRVSLTRILFWLKKSTTCWSESSRYYLRPELELAVRGSIIKRSGGVAPSCVKYRVGLNNSHPLGCRMARALQFAEGRVRCSSPKGACAVRRRRARAPWCSQSSESMGP